MRTTTPATKPASWQMRRQLDSASTTGGSSSRSEASTTRSTPAYVVPEKLDRLLSQRSRWARGMLEGLHAHPPLRQPRVLAKLVAGIDYLIPVLDAGIVFFWVPGVILFLFGYPLIFGWWSMLLLPVTLAVFACLQRWQARNVFRALDIHPRPDKRGFLGYVFVYPVLTSAAALRGYCQYVVGSSRRWQ